MIYSIPFLYAADTYISSFYLTDTTWYAVAVARVLAISAALAQQEFKIHPAVLIIYMSTPNFVGYLVDKSETIESSKYEQHTEQHIDHHIAIP